MKNRKVLPAPGVEQFYSYRQCRAALGNMPESTWFELKKSERINTVRAGRRCLVPHSELARLVEKMRSEGLVIDRSVL